MKKNCRISVKATARRLFYLLMALVIAAGLQTVVFQHPATAYTPEDTPNGYRTLNDIGGGFGGFGGFDFNGGIIDFGGLGGFGGAGGWGHGDGGFGTGAAGFGGGGFSFGPADIDFGGGFAGGGGGEAGCGGGSGGGGGMLYGGTNISYGFIDASYLGGMGGFGGGEGSCCNGASGFGGSGGFGSGEISFGCIDLGFGAGGASGAGGHHDCDSCVIGSFAGGYYYIHCDCNCHCPGDDDDDDDGDNDVTEIAFGGISERINPVITISLQNGPVISYPVTSEGALISDAIYTSVDGLITLVIPAGTLVLNMDTTPTYLNQDADIFSSSAYSETAPAGYTLISAYKFYPNGLTFSQPITLSIKAGSALPKGAQLVIATRGEGDTSWTNLEVAGAVAGEGTVAANTAAAKVNHFTYFALLSKNQ